MLKTIARAIIGIVFLFSGFAKAVDPQGGAIKIAEYIEIVGIHAGAFSVILAISLSTLEFIIGFMLLCKLMTRKAAWVAFVFMSFFTLLTLYIAIENPVSDCGCFGDAIKLTNWETFYKNMILLPLSFIVYRKRKDYKSFLSGWKETAGTMGGIIFIISISAYCVYYLPIIDFRPFKVGQNIPAAMTIPDDAPQAEYETTFILEKEGVRKEFDINNYPYEDSTWVFIDQESILIKEGYQPPIQSFSLETIDGYDMSGELLEHVQPVFFVIAPKIEKASVKHIDQLKGIHKMCMEHNYPFYVLTSSLAEIYFEFDAKHSAGFEYLSVDETLLKTICRGNPGLIILSKGTIIAKYNHTNLPHSSDLIHPLSHEVKILKSLIDKWLLATMTLLLVGFVVILYRIK